MYVVTEAGRHGWVSQDVAVPEQYRLFLWMLDVQGEKRALRSLLKEHPERLMRDWLAELEELGFVESESDHSRDHTQPLSLTGVARRRGEEAAAALAGTGAYIALDSGRRRRVVKLPAETVVLIVEDDPDQLALADLRLTLAGYQVRRATCIDDLLQRLRINGTPDLLILDVELPDGNGFELLSKMRRHPKYANLPIVMLTSRNDPEDIGRGLAWGADGYITKPYSKNMLSDVISKVLK